MNSKKLESLQNKVNTFVKANKLPDGLCVMGAGRISPELNSVSVIIGDNRDADIPAICVSFSTDGRVIIECDGEDRSSARQLAKWAEGFNI